MNCFNYNEPLCSSCKKPLNESQGREEYKSCPKCSKEKGIHVFYKNPDAFGCTDHRVTKSNPCGVQSYCNNCRSGKPGPFEGAVYCDEFKQ